jgi:CRP-like cAMP-binding protein
VTLDDDVARIVRTPPFTLLPREAVQLIAFSCEKRRLREGEALFFAGETADSAYLVHSGGIMLVEERPETKDERRAGVGVLIGESALYASASRRVSARAVEETIVIRIPRETFRRVLTEFPAGAKKIHAALAARTRRLVDGLDAVRVNSLEGPPTPKARASQ